MAEDLKIDSILKLCSGYSNAFVIESEECDAAVDVAKCQVSMSHGISHQKKIDHHDESYTLVVLVRASFPVRGSLSVRAQFHNAPVSLPPPPSVTPTERLIANNT